MRSRAARAPPKRRPRTTRRRPQSLPNSRPKPLAENYFRLLKGSSPCDRYHGCRKQSTRRVTATLEVCASIAGRYCIEPWIGSTDETPTLGVNPPRRPALTLRRTRRPLSSRPAQLTRRCTARRRLCRRDRTPGMGRRAAAAASSHRVRSPQRIGDVVR